MSRGFSWQQVELVIALATGPKPTGELAQVVAADMLCTEPFYLHQCRFVARRALQALQRRGLVQSEIRRDRSRWWWLTDAGRDMAEPLVTKRAKEAKARQRKRGPVNPAIAAGAKAIKDL